MRMTSICGVNDFADDGFKGLPFGVILDFQLFARAVKAVLPELRRVKIARPWAVRLIAGEQSQRGHAAAEKDASLQYIHNFLMSSKVNLSGNRTMRSPFVDVK